MDELIMELEHRGCDMKVTLERFLDDKDFYKNCLLSVLSDENFIMLGDYIKSNDLKGSFECAHTLKGLIANMGIEELYNIIVKIVEPLRNGNLDELTDLYNELMEKKNIYDELVHKYIK